tara:strand:+ start:715 stop:1125 length:411 start_codon:yes stop_codon:yes gene_type:complete
MIKLLFALIVMVSTVEAQTPAEILEAQIVGLQTQRDSIKADSLAGVYNDLTQADSTLAANSISIITHIGYGWTVSYDFPAFDFSDSTFSADKAGLKSLAIMTLKTTYGGIVDGDYVRMNYREIDNEVITALADIIK